MSEAPSKSFTSRKLDLQHRICADRRVTDGQFRMFVRVLRAVNAITGVAVIGDETIMGEVPSCGSPSTCKTNRRRLQTLGYWLVRPGHGNETTEYTIDLEANVGLAVGLAEARLVRLERRRRNRKAWRDRKAEERRQEGHAHTALPDDGDGYADDRLQLDGDRYAETGGDGHAYVGETGMQDPPYTFMTPSTGSPSYRAADGTRYLQEDHIDSDGVIIPRSFLSRLGGGDVDRGRELADHVPPGLLTTLLDRSSKFGVTSIAAEIDSARKQAIAAIERRASA